jgi:hypothetical protein
MITIICLVAFLLCGNMRIDAKPEQRIRLYTMYTDSHEVLLKNWFLPSLKHLKNEFDVRIVKFPQECPSGNFGKEGWNQTVRRKVEMHIQAIKETMGSWFVFSDVDIQFFEPIKDDLFKRLANYDLVVQVDNPRGGLCSGFFACKSNERTLKFWEDVLALMLQDSTLCDQKALRAIAHRTRDKVRVDRLPAIYLSGGTLTGTTWRPGRDLPVPKGIKLHHANWTHGIKNKIAQLKYVLKIVSSRKKEKNKNVYNIINVLRG